MLDLMHFLQVLTGDFSGWVEFQVWNPLFYLVEIVQYIVFLLGEKALSSIVYQHKLGKEEFFKLVEVDFVWFFTKDFLPKQVRFHILPVEAS